MVSDRDREGSDDDAARIPPEEIVEAIRTAPNPVVNTRYLAEEFGVPVDEMFEELDSLAADGVVEKLEIRGYLHLWQLSLETELDE